MEHKDIDRRLEEMWKNVSGKSYVPEVCAPASDTGAANFDTLRLMKDNFSKAEAEWRRLLEMKEAGLRELSARLEETKSHLAELRQQYHLSGEKLIGVELSTALNLEESQKALASQKKNHCAETALLNEVLERTRNELVSLGARADALRRERDAWQEKFSALSVSESDLRDKTACLERRAADSKEAVERTLSELLSERRSRQEAEGRIRALEKSAGELSSALEAAKVNWDAERTQWRELWDRERSVWETHRQEFAVWEERLRSEREAWTARMREEENKGVQAASGLSALLKDTSEWSEKVTRILKLYALNGVQLPQVFVNSPAAANAAPARIFTRMTAAALAAVMVMGAGAWWLHDFRTEAHLKLVGVYELDAASPAGLAVSGDGFWVSDWKRGLLLKDTGDLSTVKVFGDAQGGPFHPAALAVSGDGLWALDMAQLRFVKKGLRDGSTIESVRTPGQAPQALAYDGYCLWSFDAASGLLYKYSLDPQTGVSASYAVKGLRNLLAMQWRGSELWTLDSKNFLARHSFKDGAFRLISSQKLKDPALAFCADGSSFWTLEEEAAVGGYVLKKFALRLY